MATQRTLVKDMIPWVAELVSDAGVSDCEAAGRAQIVRAIDLACEALVTRIDSEGLLFDWYVEMNQGCIALPQDCREARYIVLNGVPLRQRDEWYVGKVATGRCFGGCSVAECLDLGDFYIPQPLPKRRGIRIALVATNQADSGKVCTIEIRDEYGVPRKEDITLLGDFAPAIMNAVGYDVTYFLKPKTLGSVLLQLHYDDGARFNFCSYLPDTEEGLFRRKSVPRQFWGCNIAKVKGKLRFVPITSEEQIMPFNHRGAMRFAVQAIARQTAKDLAGYDAFMARALNELNKQMADADSARNTRQVTFLVQGATPSQASNFRPWT